MNRYMVADIVGNFKYIPNNFFYEALRKQYVPIEYMSPERIDYADQNGVWSPYPISGNLRYLFEIVGNFKGKCLFSSFSSTKKAHRFLRQHNVNCKIYCKIVDRHDVYKVDGIAWLKEGDKPIYGYESASVLYAWQLSRIYGFLLPTTYNEFLNVIANT